MGKEFRNLFLGLRVVTSLLFSWNDKSTRKTHKNMFGKTLWFLFHNIIASLNFSAKHGIYVVCISFFKRLARNGVDLEEKRYCCQNQPKTFLGIQLSMPNFIYLY